MPRIKPEFSEPLKLFLASSAELKQERDRAEILVRRLNRTFPLENKPEIDLEIWETFSEVMPPTRTQNVYNESIKDRDLFILVLWTKAGKYTQEEFHIAEMLFNKLERPRILILQKFCENPDPSLPEFLSQFKQEGSEYFFRQFGDLSEFELILTTEIDHLYRWKYAINLNPKLQFRKFLLPGLMNRYNNRLNGKMESEAAFKLNLQLRYIVDKSAKGFLHYKKEDQHASLRIEALTDLTVLFKRSVKRLLITGSPGSGKTTLMLELAKELTQAAIFDPNFPIPMLLNIDTWTRKHDFEHWLEINLVSSAGEYGISKELAKRIVHENNMILLLDGFDEIAEEHRDSFWVAIKKYLIRLENTQVNRKYPQLIITSRRIEYLQSKEDAYVRGVMDILPLNWEQVRNYLCAKIDDNYSAKLLLDKLETDKSLASKIDTAFLLHLSLHMVHDYDFKAFDELTLIEQYSIKELSEQPFTTDQLSNKYLKYLAQRLYQRSQGMSFDLADLQPYWLNRPLSFRLYYAAYCVVMSGLGGILIAFCFVLTIEDLGVDEVGDFIIRMFALGAYCGLAYWLSTLLFKNEIKYGEMRSLTIKNWNLQFFKSQFRNSYKVGIVVGTLLPLGMIFVQSKMFDFITYFYFAFGCVVIGQLAGVSFGVVDGIVNGFFRTQPFPKKVKHYQTLKASLVFDFAKSFVKFQLLYFFTYLMLIAYTNTFSILKNFNTVKQVLIVVTTICIASMCSAIVNFMVSSPLVKHFILRIILAAQGKMPFMLVRFLSSMTKTGIVEEEGAKWRFRHLLLQEYFATNRKDTNFKKV
jgi:hypothetical protein